MARRVLSAKIISFIEGNASRIAEEWINDIKNNETTPTYRHVPREELMRNALFIYRQIGHWVDYETSKDEIAQNYFYLGVKRFKEGVPLGEVVYALILARRHIWIAVESEGLFSTALEMYQYLDLINRVVLFFDRVTYYVVDGYEKARAAEMYTPKSKAPSL